MSDSESDNEDFLTIDMNKMIRLLEKSHNKLANRITRNIANKHNLNEEEIKEKLNFKYPKRNKQKENKKKELYPIPFSKNNVDEMNLCHCLSYKDGLLTQCRRKKQNGINYCSICNKSKVYEKNGTIHDRLNHDLYDYETPEGKKPVPYMNLIPSHVSIDDIKNNLKLKGIEIDEEHFKRPRTSEKISRKKKQSIVIEPINNTPTCNTYIISPLNSPPSTPPNNKKKSQKSSNNSDNDPTPIITQTKSKKKKQPTPNITV